MDDNFVPFGEEWKKEMMKCNKDFLVEMVAITAKRKHELEERLNDLQLENIAIIDKFVKFQVAWLEKLKPDYEPSTENYQHGFHDALQVVKDRLNKQIMK